VTNSLLSVTGTLHGRPRHLSAVCKMKQREVVSYVILAEEYRAKYPQEWSKLASITSEEAMEVYMVEVVAKSHL
jgi:hypothetical protein